MKKIILPLEDTARSLLALQYVKKNYSPEEAELNLVMVDEAHDSLTVRTEEMEKLMGSLSQKLDLIRASIAEYTSTGSTYLGKAGPRIVKAAREYGADLIVMTKSSQADKLSMVGRTTEYVLNNAPCSVLVVCESKVDDGEYRGLVYKKAQSVVNLRGQIGDKQSECLLPSVNADCIYEISVTVGKVRFFHTAYNPETKNWDLPPAHSQKATEDIAAGETQKILVKAGSREGKADRIRIVNRGMKQEAVFTYKITPLDSKEPTQE